MFDNVIGNNRSLGMKFCNYCVSVLVVTVMMLSLTVTGKNGGIVSRRNTRLTASMYQERLDRYPIAEGDDFDPGDPVKRAKLKRQKEYFSKDAPFSNPGPRDEALEFLPEFQFNFPAFPVSQSDFIVIGEVLNAKAHQSNNKLNVFSNFDVRADEVLKGTVSRGEVITIQRIGGFVIYPGGRKVLFRLVGNGMPGVGGRYALFLKAEGENNMILTGYELSPQGVIPLDHSQQFETYQGTNETGFLQALRDAVSHHE